MAKDFAPCCFSFWFKSQSWKGQICIFMQRHALCALDHISKILVVSFIKMSPVCEEWYVEARGWNLDYSSFSPKCITKFIKGFFRKKGLQIALFYYSIHPNCSIVPNVPNKHGTKLLNHIWWKLFFLLMIMKMLELTYRCDNPMISK